MKNADFIKNIIFPEFSGIRCLMMPYIQGDFESVPDSYRPYKEIIESIYLNKGDVGFLTIDESFTEPGKPHRGSRAKFNRALHTEAGKHPDKRYAWGGNWGHSTRVLVDKDVRILLANNSDNSCALWDDYYENTSLDGDIGDKAEKFPYENAIYMKAGQVYEIGILTPHESLPVKNRFGRQFLRIVSSGIHGREEYFTENPKLKL